MRGLDGEGRLARAGQPRHGDPGAGRRGAQQPLQLGQFLRPAGEVGVAPGQVHAGRGGPRGRAGAGGSRRLARPRPGQGRIALQDPPLELAGGRAGLDAQFLHQGLPQQREHPQRLRLAAAPVQRHHQMRVELLVQPVLRHQLVQLRQYFAVAPQVQLGADPLVQRRHAGLVQPDGRAVQYRPVRGVRQHGPPPQREGLPVGLRGGREVTGQQGPVAAPGQLLEGYGVQRPRPDPQHVARATGDERRPAVVRVGAAKHFAQVGHVHLEGRRRGARRRVRPELVDEGADRHHLVRPHQQGPEHHPQLRGLRGVRRPGIGVGADLQRSQYPEAHAAQ